MRKQEYLRGTKGLRILKAVLFGKKVLVVARFCRRGHSVFFEDLRITFVFCFEDTQRDDIVNFPLYTIYISYIIDIIILSWYIMKYYWNWQNFWLTRMKNSGIPWFVLQKYDQSTIFPRTSTLNNFWSNLWVNVSTLVSHVDPTCINSQLSQHFHIISEIQTHTLKWNLFNRANRLSPYTLKTNNF